MKIIKFLFILAVVGGILFLGYFQCKEVQENKISKLEEKIALLKEEHTPIRFKITEKTDETIKVKLKFYNANNEEINEFETQVDGQELSFDFYVVSVKDNYVAFPSKLFSNTTAASNGTELYDMYDKDGYPAVFQSDSINADLYDGLKEVFEKIKAGETDSLDSGFGNMVHDIKSFKSFLPETIYSIVTHSKGGIEIVEE